ncbi:MAG: hypothetical protein HY785_11760 [Oscillatoriophycideae cyanobacterium NC_groundwater_1537_Pr4_S-0.65um_50_18]|nr:hypothetical protein [Oscillatoriophycideae cyanobacterium NC_groundwater_1537_Pr4_S-0.65um_50_18]
MSFQANFQPSQIVCLECQAAYLYAEVIQVVEQRQLCWVRPIALVEDFKGKPVSNQQSWNQGNASYNRPGTSDILYDLREGSDLLCPASLFRPALDTEVIPILTELESHQAKGEEPEAGALPISSSRHQLQAFIRRVWQAYPQAFQS